MKYFDHCFYINLEKRKDRNRHFIENVIPFLNIERSMVTRFNAVDTSDFDSAGLRAIGCAQSHLDIYNICKLKKYSTVLIMEDDFIPIISSSSFYKRLEYLYTYFSDFNICQLSYNDSVGDVVKAKPLDDSEIVLFSNKVQTTSAYLIKINFCDMIKPHIQNSINKLQLGGNPLDYAIDQTWKRFQTLQNKWYLLKRCGIQAEDYSDIEGRMVRYGC